MIDLEPLSKLTRELAEEIHKKESGLAFKSICIVFDNLKSIISIIDSDCKFIYLNKAAIDYTHDLLKIDISIGDHCLKLLGNDSKLCESCSSKKCVNERRIISEVFKSPNTHIKYWKTAIPLIYDGISGVIIILENNYD